MWALLICSIVGLIFIIERGIAYYRIKGDTASIVAEVRDLLMDNKLRQAVDFCEDFDHPVAVTTKSGLLRFGKSHEEIEKAMESVAPSRNLKTGKGIVGYCDHCQYRSPVRVTGTVTGMISSFEALAEVGLGNPEAVAGGISEALITTATGLMIALPTQTAYNYFTNRVSQFAMDMEISSSVLLETFSEVEEGEQEKSPDATA